MKKILGYFIAIVGLVGLLLTYNTIKTALGIKIPAGLTNNVLTIISLLIIVAGIILVVKFSNTNKKISEVPIYHGKDVVGFRRLGKK